MTENAPKGPRRFRTGVVAALLGVCSFGLFALTAGSLVGYEPETAGVSEGLVKVGAPRLVSGSLLAAGTGFRGRDGLRYGRATLTQPVLEAPFYWVGEKLDDLSTSGKTDRWRVTLLQLFDPAMAAVAVAAIFLLLCLRGASQRRALLVSGLCAVASLVWPYSKIGMDTTLMAAFAVTVAVAAWTARGPNLGRAALLGCAVAVTINAKGYGALLLLGVVPLLVPAWRRVRERRVAILAAAAAPVLLGLAVLGWYNWYRTGSLTSFGDTYVAQRVLAMPFAALGLLVSPGKGLIFYSPLVVLGALGLRDLWRADRSLAETIVVTVAINVVFIATSWAWTDETWGPRYLVPSAWLLLLPIAWWLTSRRRRRWLIAVAAVAVCVQIAGVVASYGSTITANRVLASEPVYLYGHFGERVAYGDDGPRWIPQASPLLLNLELTAAYVKEKITGTGFTVTYKPWRGNLGVLDLRHATQDYKLPDFWWNMPGTTTKQKLLAVLLALLSIGSGVALVRGPLRAVASPTQ